jgi:hypothetical protein
MVGIPKKVMFDIELHDIIFGYLKKQLDLTIVNNPDWGNRVITIALFVKKRQKELLELLKKHARDK